MSRIEYKSVAQIKQMRAAGLVVAETLNAVGEAVTVGVTTGELDQIGRDILAAHGAASSFLGYGAAWGMAPFPAVACVSVNEVVVHGIPGDRALGEGDIVSYDFGAYLNGWHGDACRTFVAGQTDQRSRDLIATTREAMWAGITAVRPGARIGDVAAAIQASIEGAGDFGIIRDYTGHGIGSQMHQDPDVPNAGRAGRGPRIKAGMVLAIEPMLTLGTEETETAADEWTVSTTDGSRAAHWENTVAVLPDGLWVLTEIDGGVAELSARGARISALAR